MPAVAMKARILTSGPIMFALINLLSVMALRTTAPELCSFTATARGFEWAVSEENASCDSIFSWSEIIKSQQRQFCQRGRGAEEYYFRTNGWGRVRCEVSGVRLRGN